MTLYTALLQPFLENDAMRRALVACIALAFGGAPLGVFLALRRMTMMGDTLSHAILPGVAIAFVAAGAAPLAMTAGGLAAGLLVACIAGVVTRLTPLKEDASFTGMYMISLALGVLIVTANGQDEELLHMLFGNALAITDDALRLVVAMSGISMVVMSIIYRGLVVECFDPGFLRIAGGRGALYHQLFMVLVVVNLVAAFQAMGTLMGLGLMILPAIATRLWTRTIDSAILLAIGFTLFSAVAGLLAAHQWSYPPGPSIVLAAGFIYIGSIIFGRVDGIVQRWLPHKHLAG